MIPRTVSVALLLMLLTGIAVAADEKVTFKPTFTTHALLVKVISLDAKGKTITYLDADGQTKTAPVVGVAIRQMRTISAGEMYTLICEDNAKGEHIGINGIRRVNPSMAPADTPAAKPTGK
jgi:hypothetical protein